MEYSEYPPPLPLAPLVRCFWTLAAPAGGGAPEPALPDGSPELIINLGDPFEAHTPDGQVQAQPRVMLVGQVTRPFVVAPTGTVALVAARFTPAGASLLHRPMSSITDRWRDVADILPGVPGDDLHIPSVRTALADALSHLVADGRPPSAIVTTAIARIEESHGAVPMAAVAAELSTTLRLLQRRFQVEVGINPKLLARMRRFHRVLATWRDTPGEWARVAVSCGYFDQAHLVRDFVELGGGAPAELLARMPEFTRLFTPLRRG